MKNLKTIIAILVLSSAMFSCQTNDELRELEISNEIKIRSLNGYTNIVVQFNNGISESEKNQIRNNFAANFSFISINQCDKNKEVWVVDYVEYHDYFEVLSSLYHLDDTTTTLSGGHDDEVPDPSLAIPVGNFKIKYEGNCSHNFN